MLELLSGRKASPGGLFPGYKHRNKRRVFDYWEVGELLDGLAHCPAPAIDGLNEGPFTLELHDDRDRLRRYRRSMLSLAPFGKAILENTEDFSRPNPIHRWWGGTELTTIGSGAGTRPARPCSRPELRTCRPHSAACA
jgi:hypothetical protein